MSGAILVTGATGNVGSEIVRLLPREQVRIASRTVTEGQKRYPDGYDIREFNFERPETLAPALVGVEKIFLMRPPALANVPRYFAPAIEAMRAAGVQQVVFLSLVGADRNRVVPHHKIEKLLEASSMAWTFLRASFFMQNLSTTHRDEIRDDHELALPSGNGRTSFIDVRDIAAVGAKALLEPGHERKAYTLTGPEALTYGEVTALMTEILGVPIRYRQINPLAFVRLQMRRGNPLAYALVTTVLYTTARFGLAGSLTDELQAVLGRAPRTVRQFIQDYRAVWLQPESR